MLLVEVSLALLALFLGLTFPGAASHLFEHAELAVARLSRRRRLAVAVVGLSALGLRLALLPVLPIPNPVVHDEFSHLLLADTLAHGRLANPTHPMWIHFESFHINHKPTYASMYNPGPAIFMAAGQVIAGHPFWGVWFSAGVMCAAICWALQGWLPPFWALLGGLFAVIRLGTFSYWANSYRGGAVTAIGGALVLGALPRIKRRLRIRDSVLMGVGVAMLVSSRPYEGLFFCIPIAIALFAWMFKRNNPPLPLLLRRVLIPVGLLLCLTFAGMGYYFWRVTGNPFRPGYQINNETYGVYYFPWEKLRPTPQYHHLVMRNFYLGEANIGEYWSARAHPVRLLFFKSCALWLFYLGPALTLPLLLLALALPYGISYKDLGRKPRFLLIICGATCLAVALPACMIPAHYVAATTTTVYALVLLAMQRLRLWQRHSRRTGAFFVRAVVFICVLLFVMRAAAPVLGLQIAEPFVSWSWPRTPLAGRAPVVAQLSAYPGAHLVIVRYGPDHDPAFDWVYNDADIDNEKIVWARDMGAPENEELVRYFKGRHVWLLEPDDSLSLLPYGPDVAGASKLASSTNQNCDASRNLGGSGCHQR